MKILIIDDDPLHLSSLETSLIVRNYQCRSFLSPGAAIEAYQSEPFDVIITAVKMLEITGEEVLKKVRRINPKAKVILITGFDDVKIKAGERSGAYAFFRKPIVINDLIHTLEKINGKAALKPGRLKPRTPSKTRAT